jgi:hypothetical protein
MNPGGQIVGYCRACGKALDEASVHTVAGTIYCAEHAPAQQAAAASPYVAPPPAVPLRPADSSASPGWAFVLGFIPGVGAIYNGQYAKGLIHVVVIGLMISILDSSSVGPLGPLFGFLLAGFWMYMPFEAYHTCKRRLRGETVDEFSSLVPLKGQPGRVPVAPLVLIGLGVLFLLNNLEILYIRDMLKYWPIALIGLGVYMLYVRLSAAPEPMTPQEAGHERQ